MNENEELDDLRVEDGNAIWRLFSEYGREQWVQFTIGAVASVFQMSMELIPAFVLAVAIDSFFMETSAFGLPFVPDAWLPTAVYGQFVLVTVLVGASYALNEVLGWINNYMWNSFSQQFQHSLRVDTYDAMQHRETGFFDNKQTGEVMSILNNDVNQLEGFLTNDLNSAITILVRVGGMGLIMLLVNWQLALIPVFAIPVLGYLSHKFRQLVRPKYRLVRKSVGQLNSRLENNLGGIETVKAYTTESFEAGRVSDASRTYLDAQWDAIITRITFFPTISLTTATSYVLVFFVGGLWVIQGQPPHPLLSGGMTAGTLVLFLSYTRRFTWPMRRVGRIFNNYQYAEAAGERITGLLDREPRIADQTDAEPLVVTAGRVEFDDVSFSYEDEDGETHEVLRDISFSAEPGEYVGLVGSTGAGKSTMMKLLLRFYDVDEGEIRVDGHDIRDVTLRSLRRSIGYISQEPYLFYGTVVENIAYGLSDADEDDVVRAAEIAGAHEFIENLPDEYETMVGERGVKLSGGQRQRIALARAVLRDPDILILDEATSHVDNETEALIQSSLDGLIENRTTFAIAHRLSTVRNADTIVVLDEGEIVERGTHADLLGRDGLYANFWSVQVGEMDALPEAFIEETRRRQSEIYDE